MLNPQKFNSSVQKEASVYLDSLKRHFNDKRKTAIQKKNSTEKSLLADFGKDSLNRIRDRYQNERLMTLALELDNPRRFIYTKKKIVQKMDPGYMITESGTGRAHFYASYKLFRGMFVDTFIFNIAVIWIVSVVLYTALYYKIFWRFVESFSYMKKRRLNKIE